MRTQKQPDNAVNPSETESREGVSVLPGKNARVPTRIPFALFNMLVDTAAVLRDAFLNPRTFALPRCRRFVFVLFH